MFVRKLAVVMAVGLAAGQAVAGEGKGKEQRTQSQGSMQQGGQQGTGSSSQSKQGGTASSSQQGDLDPLMKPGSAVKGHASDQVITGRVGKISGDSVSIESGQGESKKLELAPQTMIDGKADNKEALKEGQEVRASFSQVEGKDVAVEIHSRKGGSSAPASEGKSSGPMGSGSTGSSGSSGSTGSSGSQGSGDGASGSKSQSGSTQQR